MLLFQCLGRIVSHDLPFIQKDHPVTELVNFPHVVRGYKNGLPPILLLAQQLMDQCSAHGVQPYCWLVKDE